MLVQSAFDHRYALNKLSKDGGLVRRKPALVPTDAFDENCAGQDRYADFGDATGFGYKFFSQPEWRIGDNPVKRPGLVGGRQEVTNLVVAVVESIGSVGLRKISLRNLSMCPAPHAGSRQVSFPRSPYRGSTCSNRARVAQGGVGKSSLLSFASVRWAITACDRFCMMVYIPNQTVSADYALRARERKGNKHGRMWLSTVCGAPRSGGV